MKDSMTEDESSFRIPAKRQGEASARNGANSGGRNLKGGWRIWQEGIEERAEFAASDRIDGAAWRGGRTLSGAGE